jgi:hypothetical protein
MFSVGVECDASLDDTKRQSHPHTAEWLAADSPASNFHTQNKCMSTHNMPITAVQFFPNTECFKKF